MLSTPSVTALITDVENVASYSRPGILASYNGEIVRLVATGDSPGHSPVCQFIDTNGKLSWAEQEAFTVIDQNYLPPSTNALRTLAKLTTST